MNFVIILQLLLGVLLVTGCANRDSAVGYDKYVVRQDLYDKLPQRPNLYDEIQRDRSVFFDQNLDYISDSFSIVLTAHARFMKMYPNAAIVLFSYADDTASMNDNLVLAKRRADRVRRELINIGVDKSRILSVTTQALANVQNSLPANRRVDIFYKFY